MSYDLKRILNLIIDSIEDSPATSKMVPQVKLEASSEQGRIPPPPRFDTDQEAINLLKSMKFGQTVMDVSFTAAGLEVDIVSDKPTLK